MKEFKEHKNIHTLLTLWEQYGLLDQQKCECYKKYFKTIAANKKRKAQ